MEEFSINDFLHGKEKFTFTLPENEGDYSSPARATYLLEGVSLIYEAISETHGKEGNDLAFLSCDSGSDKVFDFAGSGEIVKEIRLLFIEVWDRIVFYKQRSHQLSADAISNSLPLIEKISHMERDGVLVAEQAEILKRKLLKGIDKIIDSGAITPEMENRKYENARAIMQPQPKLIAAPHPTTMQQHEQKLSHEEENEEKPQSLSDLEVATLRQLLNRASNEHSSPSPKRPGTTKSEQKTATPGRPKRAPARKSRTPKE